MDWLQSLWIYTPGEFALAAVIVMAGAFIRGVTGFGAGLVMVPLLSLMWGPVEALATMFGLSLFNSTQMMPMAFRSANFPLVIPIMIVAAICTPVGIYLHVSLDPELVKKMIAALVLLATLISLSGWKYKGPSGLAPSGIAGGLMGLINGIAGVGGPPLVLYLMSLPGKAIEHRANITLAMSITTYVALISMYVTGVFGQRILTHISMMLIPSMIGVWLGSKAFHLIPGKQFRLLVLWFLVAVSLSILFS